MSNCILFITTSFLFFTTLVYSQTTPYINVDADPNPATEPATVTIEAEAYDLDGSIHNVEFYLCGTSISTTNIQPYKIILKDLSAGNYCVLAKATDNEGIYSFHSVTITVNEAPVTCENAQAYIENGGYDAGKKVLNQGHLYECKTWPNSGWCNGPATAYEPGIGSHWTDAWIELTSCPDDSLVCDNTPEYEEYSHYGPESLVVQDGVLYECKAWPNSGWCSGAAWAYAPGYGLHWEDAWTVLGNCSSSESRVTKKNSISITPHPFEQGTKIQLLKPEVIHAVEIINTHGTTIYSNYNVAKTELTFIENLAPGYYILHLKSKSGHYSKPFIKK